MIYKTFFSDIELSQIVVVAVPLLIIKLLSPGLSKTLCVPTVDGMSKSNSGESSQPSCIANEPCELVCIVYVNKKYPFKILRYWKAGKYFERNLFNGWMPPHPTVFIKRSVFNKIGKYKTNYQISSDYDFLVRVFRKKNIKKIYISKILVNMRMGGMSNNSIKNIFKKSIEDFKIIKKNKIGGFLTLFNKNFSKISQFLN